MKFIEPLALICYQLFVTCLIGASVVKKGKNNVLRYSFRKKIYRNVTLVSNKNHKVWGNNIKYFTKFFHWLHQLKPSLGFTGLSQGLYIMYLNVIVCMLVWANSWLSCLDPCLQVCVMLNVPTITWSKLAFSEAFLWASPTFIIALFIKITSTITYILKSKINE